MRDCGEFALPIIIKYEELDNCLMLRTVVNAVQRVESNDTDTCIKYTNQEE